MAAVAFWIAAALATATGTGSRHSHEHWPVRWPRSSEETTALTSTVGTPRCTRTRSAAPPPMTDVAMAAVALEQPPILREIQAVPPAAVPSVTPPCAPQVLTDSVVRCALAAAGTVRLNTIRDTPSS